MKTLNGGLFVLLAAVLISGCAVAAPKSQSSEVPPQDQSVATYKSAGGATAPGTAPSTTGQQSSATVAWDRYVIRTGEMNLAVKDVTSTVDAVTRVANEAGGYVSQSNTRRDGDSVVADIAIQVPADQFDKVLGDLKRLAMIVVSSKTTSQDVTDEFVDNEAQLRNLRAVEVSTQKLLDRAVKMEDVLAVQRELTTIRGNIEKIEGRQNYLKRRTDMSTIAIHLAPETGVSIAATRTSWQPLRTADRAWQASLTVLTWAADFFIAAAVFFWWAILLIAVFVAYWRLRRRRRRPSRPTPTPLAAS